MSAVAKLHTETATGIVKLVETTPSLVLLDREKFNEFYEEIAKEVRAFTPDLTTDKGRKEIASLAFRVTKTKTAIDDAGKKLAEDKRREVKTIDEARKTIRDELDALRDEARKPLTDWEKAEEARVARCKRDLDAMKEAGLVRIEDTVLDLEERLATLEAMDLSREAFGDFLPTARERHEQGVEALRAGIVRLQREERERAELAQLRAEAAERARIDREREERERAEQVRIERERQEVERARLAAERLAEREREEAQRRKEAEEAERRRVEEAAARAVAEAEERHAAELRRVEEEREAERLRIQEERDAERRAAEAAEAERQAEARAQRAAEEARQRDREHRGTIMREAKEAIMDACKITEAKAKEIVSAIAAGSVPNVAIRF